MDDLHAAADDERYWAGIRAQYAVSADFINLENGFFGLQSIPVFEAFQRYQVQVNSETSYFLRERYADRLARVMDRLAQFAGVQPDELLVTRNLMESLNVLIQGYPFKAGDGVLLAEHDYDGVIDTLEMVAARKSLELARIVLPLDPVDDEQIVALYEQAITPSTRVLLVTHMVHRTGQIMPVAKISAMARRHGVDVMVDAAHSFAQLDFRLPELGADFVGANLHKWLGAPLGVGLLYIRKNRIPDVAPLFGDMRSSAGDIGKLGRVGTVPPAPILAIEDALAFHNGIGSRNKEARLRYLTQYWVSRVRTLPNVQLFTPIAPERSCAIAAFGIRGIPVRRVVERLMSEYRIFTVEREIGIHQVVRVTPHLYTTIADLDRLVGAITQMAAAA